MAVSFTGKLANDGNLKALGGVFKNTASGYTALYLGFIEGATPLSDTSDIAAVDEIEGIARKDITSAMGTPALDSGVPKLKNSSQINTDNASVGESIIGFFITNTASGDGDLIAYGNVDSGSLNTNVGSPVTIDANNLVIAID